MEFLGESSGELFKDYKDISREAAQEDQAEQVLKICVFHTSEDDEVKPQRSHCGLPTLEGDVSDDRQVMGEYLLHVGQVPEKLFKWLLRNDVCYTNYL
ncbi:unnamed protein product [Gadus morhua 'NCC']